MIILLFFSYKFCFTVLNIPNLNKKNGNSGYVKKYNALSLRNNILYIRDQPFLIGPHKLTIKHIKVQNSRNSIPD